MTDVRTTRGRHGCPAPWQAAAGGHGGPWPRGGMTLLELMLALSLSAVVLVAISTAVDLHLRVLQSRRDHVEHIQVARGVLGIVAADLRATVQQNTTDFSALESLAAGLVAGGDAAGLAAALGESGGQSGDAGGTTGGQTGGATGGRTGGTTGGQTGGATGGQTGGATGGQTGGQTGGGQAAGEPDMGASASGEDGAATPATTDIASATNVPPTPGLYGNQYELQLDVSRLPRVDQFERMFSTDPRVGLQDIPSDVKTVAYYCVDANSVSSAGIVNRRTGQAEFGLVRRVLDRAITQQASQSGNVQGLAQAAQVLAPEVRQIEFMYFDGTQWLTQWDSSQQQGLPVAVKITVYVLSETPLDTDRAGRASPVAATPLSPENVYSLVVHLPTALPAASDSSSTNSSSSNSSGLDAVGL